MMSCSYNMNFKLIVLFFKAIIKIVLTCKHRYKLVVCNSQIKSNDYKMFRK